MVEVVIVLLVVHVIQFIRADFDFHAIRYSNFDLSMAIFLGLVGAFQQNRVKYLFSRIQHTDDFQKWVKLYFYQFEAVIIYETSHLIIYEVAETSRNWFRKSDLTYYEVKMYGDHATVEGPSYKLPKILT